MHYLLKHRVGRSRAEYHACGCLESEHPNLNIVLVMPCWKDGLLLCVQPGIPDRHISVTELSGCLTRPSSASMHRAMPAVRKRVPYTSMPKGVPPVHGCNHRTSKGAWQSPSQLEMSTAKRHRLPCLTTHVINAISMHEHRHTFHRLASVR